MTVFIFWVVCRLSQVVQAKVRNFQYKSRVHNAIGWFQLAMRMNCCWMQIMHALKSSKTIFFRIIAHWAWAQMIAYFYKIVHQWQLKHQIQVNFVILEDVLQRALWTIFGQYAWKAVNNSAIEANETVKLGKRTSVGQASIIEFFSLSFFLSYLSCWMSFIDLSSIISDRDRFGGIVIFLIATVFPL